MNWKKHIIRLLIGATTLAVLIFVVILLRLYPPLFAAALMTALAYFIGMIITTMEKT